MLNMYYVIKEAGRSLYFIIIRYYKKIRRWCDPQYLIDHPETSSSSEDDSSEVEERIVVKAVMEEIQVEKSRVDELPEEVIEVVEVVEEPIQPKIVKVAKMV